MAAMAVLTGARRGVNSGGGGVDGTARMTANATASTARLKTSESRLRQSSLLWILSIVPE
uniref:Uncharacterized protein n=2 Tax=Oryza sativa subsp. japonica TaxID=39947 RepID=Q69QW5_ORYSJ|nr:hypothetical protein [Oryza sativa Japonica Group]BAD31811.1 hypothetical protein [Oryza sativa Japonica Group]